MIYKNVKNEKLYESNNWGTMEVVGRKPGKLKVRFVNTGYEVWAGRGNVFAGKVSDKIAKDREREEWEPFFRDYVSNSGLEFSSFLRRRNKIKIQFKESGYCCEVFLDNAKAGKVSDPYAKTVYGVGYLGEFDKTPYWKQAKQLWQNMMKRCYSQKDKRGYYGRSFVDPRWMCFANFLEDIPKLENFDGWISGQSGKGVKYNLDKDLKIPGNTVYSRDACSFLTEYENKGAGKGGKTLTELGWN